MRYAHVLLSAAFLIGASSACDTAPRTVANPPDARSRIIALMRDAETSLTAHDLATTPQARAAVEREHALVTVHGREQFTGAALKESTPCGLDDNDNEERCFHLARYAFIALEETIHRDQTLDAEATDETFFTYRAEPASQLAKSIAKAQALICTADSGKIVPWRGADTIATGDLVRTNNVGSEVSYTLMFGCPQSARGSTNF